MPTKMPRCSVGKPCSTQHALTSSPQSSTREGSTASSSFHAGWVSSAFSAPAHNNAIALARDCGLSSPKSSFDTVIETTGVRLPTGMLWTCELSESWHKVAWLDPEPAESVPVKPLPSPFGSSKSPCSRTNFVAHNSNIASCAPLGKNAVQTRPKSRIISFNFFRKASNRARPSSLSLKICRFAPVKHMTTDAGAAPGAEAGALASLKRCSTSRRKSSGP
mmetsp:Transcript_113845/g.317988  ORF Transcript_113845/g.317988 Transcript_113845/m.317988 type:complete len:220 (+) Transcript_113845:322-981(+)